MGDADFDQDQEDDRRRGEELVIFSELGLDAMTWAKAFIKVFHGLDQWQHTKGTLGNAEFELESLMVTWFANAIEKGRDDSAIDRDVQEGNEGINETVGERAIRLLNECADALEALPAGMRTAAMGGLLGNIPLNNIDHLRQEAQDILLRMDAAAAATREV